MAENILINFDANVQELTKTIDLLEKMGLVAKKDADAFKALGTSSNPVVDGQNKIQKELTETEKLLSTIALQGQKTNAILADSGNKVSAGAAKAKAGLGGLDSTLKNIGGTIAGAFAVTQLVSFGKEAIKLSANFNSVKNAINFVQGGAEQGAVAFQYLTDLSQRLGLEIVSTANAFKLFSASAQLGGISADETKEIFTSVAEATTALGLTAEDTNGVFLALSQIVSKGTVQAEELRGQIGERLPGAFELAAKSMGVTTKELNKLLEGGKVLSKDFLPGFAATLKETFSGALPQAVNGAQANLNRLSNLFTEFKVSVGDSLNSVVGSLFKTFGTPLSEKIQEEANNLDVARVKILGYTQGQAERTKIIKELQAQYPDYLGNINAETVSNEDLLIALDKVNNSLLVKIALQKSDEAIADQNEDTAEALLKLTEARTVAIKQISNAIKIGGIANKEYNEELLKGLTLEEQIYLLLNGGIKLRGVSASSLVGLGDAQKNLNQAQLEFNKEQIKSSDLIKNRVKEEKDLLDIYGLNEKATEKSAENNIKLGDSLDQLKAKLESLKKEQGAIPDVLGGGKKRFEELGKEIDILQAKIDKLTGKGKKADGSDKKNADKEIIDSRTLLNDALTEADEEQRKKEENANKLREQNHQDINDAIEAADKQLKKDQEDLIKENLEAEKKAAEEKLATEKAVADAIVNLARGTIDAIADVTNAYYEQRIEQIDRDKERILESYDEQLEANEDLHSKNKKGDRQYENDKKKLEAERKKAEEKADKEKRKLMHDQAVFNKAIAITNSIINTAVAVTANLAVPVVAALVAILGAIEVAAIIAQPIPGYAKGKERIEGRGTETSDDVPARLSVGERVVRASTNRKYFPILSAIHHERFDPETMNSLSRFSPETLRKLATVDQSLIRDLATMQPVFMKHVSNVPDVRFRNDITPRMQSAHLLQMVNYNVAAGMNEYDMSRALKKGTKVDNVKEIAKEVGKEIIENMGENIRRKI